MTRIIALCLVAVLCAPAAALAADQTVVLTVKNADCILCPPIVKQSLTGVAGVKAVDIKQADQMAPFIATVRFDDAVADVSKLVAATTNAGYPSAVAK